LIGFLDFILKKKIVRKSIKFLEIVERDFSLLHQIFQIDPQRKILMILRTKTKIEKEKLEEFQSIVKQEKV
jgi:hypothetical protein